MRISIDKCLMNVAIAISKRGTCKRLQVGAVISNSGRIISTGYNGAVSTDKHCSKEVCDINFSCKRSVHAEANAIIFAARHGVAVKGCSLYITHSPCLTCAGLIINAGISSVIFETLFRDHAGVQKLKDLGIKVMHLEDDNKKDFYET